MSMDFKIIRIALGIIVIIFLSKTNAFSQINNQKKMSTNKQLVETYFEKWSSGTGNFFDLLDENVQWTISGSSALSKIYTSKKQLIDEVIDPLNERLSKRIVPSIRNIYQDSNTVIAIWDGSATALDGQPYNVSYAWFMEMKDGKIVKVTAFLDTLDFETIFKRIKVPAN